MEHGTQHVSGTNSLTSEFDRVKELKAVLLARKDGGTTTFLSTAAEDYVRELNTVAGKLLEEKTDTDLAGRMLNEAEFITREEEGYFYGKDKEREEHRAAVYSNLAYLAKINDCDDDAVMFLLEAAMLEGEPRPATNVSLALLLLDMGRYDSAISSAQHAVTALQGQRTAGSISQKDLNVLACACHILSLAQSGSVIPERRCEAARNLQKALLYASEVGDDSDIAKKVRSTMAYNDMACPMPPSTHNEEPAFYHRGILPRPKSYEADTFDPIGTFPPTLRPKPPDSQEGMSKTMGAGRRSSFSRKEHLPKLPDLHGGPETKHQTKPKEKEKVKKPKRHTPFAELDFCADGKVRPGEIVAKLVNTRDLYQAFELRLGVSTIGSAQMMHAYNGNSTDHGLWEGMKDLKPVHCLLAVDAAGAIWVAAAMKTAQIRKNGLRIDMGAERIEVGDRLVLGKSHFRCIIRPASPPTKAATPPVEISLLETDALTQLDEEGVKIINNPYDPGEEWENLESSNIRSYIQFLKQQVEEEEQKLQKPEKRPVIPSPVAPPVLATPEVASVSPEQSPRESLIVSDGEQPPHPALAFVGNDETMWLNDVAYMTPLPSTELCPALKFVNAIGDLAWLSGVLDLLDEGLPSRQDTELEVETEPFPALTHLNCDGEMLWVTGIIEVGLAQDVQPPVTVVPRGLSSTTATEGFPTLSAVQELGGEETPWLASMLDILSQNPNCAPRSDGSDNVNGVGTKCEAKCVLTSVPVSEEQFSGAENHRESREVQDGVLREKGSLTALQHVCGSLCNESWLEGMLAVTDMLPESSVLAPAPTIEYPDLTSPLVVSPRIDLRPNLVDILGETPAAELPALGILLNLAELDIYEKACTIQRAWRLKAARETVKMLRHRAIVMDTERDEAAAFIQFHMRRLKDVKRARKEVRMRQELLRCRLQQLDP